MFLFDVLYRDNEMKDVSFLYTSHFVVDAELISDLANAGITAKGKAVHVVSDALSIMEYPIQNTESLITHMIRTAQHSDSNVKIGFVSDTLLENNMFHFYMAVNSIAL